MSLLATAQPNEAERNQPMDAAAMRRPASCITRPLHYCADATRRDANEPPATRGCKRRANCLPRYRAPFGSKRSRQRLGRTDSAVSTDQRTARVRTACDTVRLCSS
jgi:hypothetical protein